MSEYTLPGFEDLEISTQIVIRDARARDIRVEVLDRKAHFLRLSKGDHVEYVKEASKTRLDSYITFLLMEHKEMSKIILQEGGLRVPAGRQYHDPEAVFADLEFWKTKRPVVKPVATNFGVGITVFAADFDDDAFRDAVREAFSHGDSIIVEEFAEGDEFRFLVIGDVCAAVANRVPANVKGDGTSTIRELVVKKNEDVRRGVGHVTPLEKIQLAETELSYLKRQQLTPEGVPDANETVFLRKNSNISTGGDSIDRTDDVHASYKDLAVRAAAAANAKICGVDIMIPHPERPATADNYAILEINFNPVLYIHNFPYEGKNRDVGNLILDALGF